MKNTRRMASFLLALVMVFAMAVTAFADGTDVTDNSITVKGEAGHTYEVYQIFTGDLSDGVLSNIVWGNGVNADGQSKFGDAAVKAASLNEDNIKTFQAELAPYLTNPATMTDNQDGTYSLNSLAAGYYLVKDKDGTQTGENSAYTAYIVQVVGAVTVEAKAGVPTVDKSVTAQGTNADDFSIGDTVTFILEATLGDELDEYETYKVVFHDTLSDGLTYGAISSVNVDGKDVTNYTAAYENGALTVTVADVLVHSAKTGSKVVVTYTATLNDNAVVGTAGNSNTVYLEYSNNPNWDGTGTTEPTGRTPDDVVKVFTYQLDVTKVDGSATTTKLANAQFVLLNQNATKVATVVGGKLTGWVAVPGDGTWPANTTLTSDANGEFHVIGLDAGEYKLRETKAPAGYNLLTADVTIKIEAALNTAEDAAALTSVSLTVNGEAASSVTVENNKGATLPSTGGMGTTILYVVGGILVLAAVVLLVTKKRMNAA